MKNIVKKLKKILASATAGIAIAGVMVVPALAAPGDNGSGYGGCIDYLYGNGY